MELPNIGHQNQLKENKRAILKEKYRQRMQAKLSFERQYDDNHDFDQLIDEEYQKMLKEKEETPSLIIPKNFEKFLKSKSFKELLKRTYEYCCLLNEVEAKYKRLKEELDEHSKERNRFEQQKVPLLRSQIEELNQKCREISFVYGGILLAQGDYRYMFKDQYFFETMIYFLCQVLKHSFDREEFVPLEEELNRIFRTNTFNIIKRRRQEDQFIKKYPVMKETKNDTMPNIINKIIERNKVPAQSRYEPKLQNATKPLFLYQSAFGSVRSRSPVMSLIFPSDKEKLYLFNKEVRRRGSETESIRNSQVDFRRDLSLEMKTSR